MSVTSHLETAEEAVRQALINALAEGDDHWLSDLFDLLNQTSGLKKKMDNLIRYSDNTLDWAKKYSEYNFNLSSDYLNSPDVIKFPTKDDIDLGLD